MRIARRTLERRIRATLTHGPKTTKDELCVAIVDVVLKAGWTPPDKTRDAVVATTLALDKGAETIEEFTALEHNAYVAGVAYNKAHSKDQQGSTMTKSKDRPSVTHSTKHPGTSATPKARTAAEQELLDVATALAKTYRRVVWQHQTSLAENEKRLCRAELALAVERGAVFCVSCKGEGWVPVLDPDDWYGHDKAGKCDVCDGNGRTEGVPA